MYFAPHIPKEWDGYCCPIAYRNAIMKIHVTKEQTVFELIDGEELSFFAGDEKVCLTNKVPCFTCATECME